MVISVYRHEQDPLQVDNTLLLPPSVDNWNYMLQFLNSSLF